MLWLLAASATPTDLESIGFLRGHTARVAQALIGVALAKLVFESLQFAHLSARNSTPLRRSAMLMLGPLRRWTVARYALGFVGIACFLTLSTTSMSAQRGASSVAAAIAGFLCLFAGELCERHLFFAASVAPRMPGGVTG
jgi:DMSO reductase anchor subunit